LTKTEIIDAAFKVWGRNFYRKTSLSQLAGELGVSKPALYRHFINKEALTSAMTERFIEDFASSIKTDFDKALQASNADEGISFMVQSITDFFAKNVYSLIFSLVNIYERNIDGKTIRDRLKTRGVDLGSLLIVSEKKYYSDPVMVRLIFATLIFFMSHFHKTNKTTENQPAGKDIKNINLFIYNTVRNGLGYNIKKVNLDFEMLEKQIEKITLDEETEPFFKAVAEAVAEAGPWDVSMEMVAKKLGFSKSSLYGHFKNKKDMLRRLFVTEFKRIISFAHQGISLSTDSAQQLYLGIFSISVYLRSRPEILIAMDWLRTRKLDLGKPDKYVEIFRLFEDIDIEPLQKATEEEKRNISHWILFLLINILNSPNNKKTNTNGQNSTIRLLYKFIILGLGGFIR